MANNINFVPDDYIESSESRRTNLMYLVLFAVVMAAFGGTFLTLRIRQQRLDTKERLITERLNQAQDAIRQFEQLQMKRKAMMKTALTTADLLEPVPRSILLASLTNNLPPKASLVRVKLIQKEPKKKKTAVNSPTSQYANQKAGLGDSEVSREKLLETHISIEGIAPTDLEVASYIEKLSYSRLFDNVALIESKEYRSKKKKEDTDEESDGLTFRRFRLAAMLRKEVRLTQEDVKRIAYGSNTAP